MNSSTVFALGKPRERLLYLDLLRCLSIFAVTVLHSALPLLTKSDRPEFLPGIVYAALCVFCVPVLLMISGTLMLTDAQPVNVATFYRKRLPKILIPLLAWSLIYYILYCVQGHTVFNIATFLKRFLAGMWSGPLWFLYMMVGVYLMLPFVRPVFGGDTKRLSLIFVGIIFGSQALYILVRLLFARDLNSYFVGALFPFSITYLVLGNVLCRMRRVPPGKRGILAAFFFLSAMAVSFGEFMAKTGNLVPQSTFYNYLEPIVAVMGVCVFLFFKDWNPSRQSKQARLTQWLSGLSYGIFLSHILVQMLLTGEIPLFFRPGTGLDWHTASPLFGPLLLGAATFVGAALLTAAIKSVPGLKRIIP